MPAVSPGVLVLACLPTSVGHQVECVPVRVCPCLCLQGFLYVRSCKADNEYAHPLDLCPLVDLNLGKVRQGEEGGRGAHTPTQEGHMD